MEQRINRNADGVSVVVCSYNGASRLPATLAHLARQRVPANLPWEVIVVENNCTDDTGEVARREWQFRNCDAPLRVVSEPRAGLAAARESGVAAASFEYIVFCDDDNWLQEDYLQIAFELLSAHPTIGIAGGEGIEISDVPFPEWFSGYRHGYAVGTQGESSGRVGARGFVWGAGMVLRKSVWDHLKLIGYRSFLSGRSRDRLLAGDDSEICKWHLLEGYSIWYEERLVFKHFISAERLTEDYRDRMFEGFALSIPFLDAYQQLIDEKRFLDFGILRFPLALAYGGYALLRRNADRGLYDLRLSRVQMLLGGWVPIRRPLFELVRMYYSLTRHAEIASAYLSLVSYSGDEMHGKAGTEKRSEFKRNWA